MLIFERIKLIVEKEVERLYDASNTVGLSEEDIRKLKVLWEIAKIQIDDDTKVTSDVDTEKLLGLLKRKSDDGQSRNSD